MTDLLDGDDFFALMQAHREAARISEISTALADVKNYIRIHCVVPQTTPVQEEQDESVPW